MENLLSYDIDPVALLNIILATVFVGAFAIYRVKNYRFRLLIAIMLFGVFFYSGYGISYTQVDNGYISKYIVFIICLCTPFLLYNKTIKDSCRYSELDMFIISHQNIVKKLAYLFLVCYFIPLVYPEFKLFEIFSGSLFSIENLWEDRWSYRENSIILMIDAFKIFLQPFFFIYLTLLQKKGTKNRVVVLLYFSTVLMLYARYSYLGRYQIIVYGLILFLLAVCVKGFNFSLNKKHVLTIVGVVLFLIPFLYAFTFIRQGTSVDSALSFSEISSLLIDSETYYPIYYDTCLHSTALLNQTPLTFILWLIFLPIPSFVFPGKPTLQGDAFTYAVTGKSFGDANFSSALPSVLGESFMYFGEYYWVEALIIGFVALFVIRYMLKSKTLTFYSIYMIVFVLTLGRGGGSSYLSTLISGSVSLIALNIYLKLNKTNKQL